MYVCVRFMYYFPMPTSWELHLSEGSEGSDPYFTVYYIENNMFNVLEICLCVLKTTNWGLEVLYDDHINHYI